MLKIQLSMGSVGDGHDNAMDECFFATLKCERLNVVQKLKYHKETETAVFEDVEGFDNTHRIHRQLNHLLFV